MRSSTKNTIFEIFILCVLLSLVVFLAIENSNNSKLHQQKLEEIVNIAKNDGYGFYTDKSKFIVVSFGRDGVEFDFDFHTIDSTYSVTYTENGVATELKSKDFYDLYKVYLEHQ